MEWVKREIDRAIAELPIPDDEEEVEAKQMTEDMLHTCLKAYEVLEQPTIVRRDYVLWVMNRLMKHMPLTPITEADFDENGECERFFGLRKEGDKYIDYSRVIVTDETGLKYRSGTISRLIHEDIPITLPYMPGREIKVDAREWTTNGEEDFDTVELKYLLGGVYKRRFFKAPEDGEGSDLIEITLKEFEDRLEATYGK